MKHAVLFWMLFAGAALTAPPLPTIPLTSANVFRAYDHKWSFTYPYFALERSVNGPNGPWQRLRVLSGDVVTNSVVPALYVVDMLDDQANIALVRQTQISKAEFDAANAGNVDSGQGHGIILYRR